MQKFALAIIHRLITLRGKARYALLLTLGGTSSLAFAPHHFLFLPVLIFPLFYCSVTTSRSWKEVFFTGWWFGFGHFVFGVYWIANSLLVEPEKFAWLIPFAVSLIPAVLALYVGAVALALYRFPGKGWKKIVAFAALWVVAEMLRGQMISNFPWNLMGYVWMASLPMAQLASVIGVHGLSFIAVLAATLPAVLLGIEKKRCVFVKDYVPLGVMAIFLAVTGAVGAVRLSYSKAHDAETDVLPVYLIQANIDQKNKWQEDIRRTSFIDHLTMTRQALDEGKSQGGYVVWSETSVSYALEEEPEMLQLIDRTLPDDVYLITGALRVERTPERKIFNSLYLVRGDGVVADHYDKSLLVPFGEYVPFRRLLPFVSKITHGSMDFSAGPGVTLVQDGALTVPFAPYICYEIIFTDARVTGERRPRWLVNVTNDAWFGDSSGPYQHLSMARMRAIEQGVPLVRVANTGISAVVDSYGRVLSQIGVNKSGVINMAMPSALNTTYYCNWNSFYTLVLMFLFLFIIFKNAKKHK